jgi:predicted SAM-dependent methyltransferase
MTDMSRVESESVDAIFSSHNIEHLYPHEVSIALKEFIRVLKPHGFAVITCPDLKSVARLIADDKLTEPAYESPAGPIAPLDILYGYRRSMALGNLYMAHRCGFTEKVLRGSLLSNGFKSVGTFSIESAFELWAVGFKHELLEEELNQRVREYAVR